MSARTITPGSTDQSTVVRFLDTDGNGADVDHATAGLALWYRREGAAKVAITPAALAALTTAHTDGGVEAVDDGYSRVDVPDAAFSAGVAGVLIGGTATDLVCVGTYHQLDTLPKDYDIHVNSATGTATGSGTPRDPVSTLAIAKTLADLGGSHRIMLHGPPMTTYTIESSMVGYHIESDGDCIVALNGQAVGCSFHEVIVSGIGTQATNAINYFYSVGFAGCTPPANSIVHDARIASTITTPVGHIHFFHANGEGGTIDFSTAANTTIRLHLGGGNITIENLGNTGTDVLYLTGHGNVTFAASCTGGTVYKAGAFVLVNGGASTIVDDDVAKTGADGDTLKTLSDQIDGVDADVWAYSPRTLTQTADDLAATLTGSALTIHRGDTASIAFTALGSVAGRTKLWFTIKAADGDPADTASIVQATEAAGLVYLNGSSSVTAADASITVGDEAAGDITITIKPASTAQLVPDLVYKYDVQWLNASGVVETLTSGRAFVVQDVTKAVT